MLGVPQPHGLTHAALPSLTAYALSSPAISSSASPPVPLLNHPQLSTLHLAAFKHMLFIQAANVIAARRRTGSWGLPETVGFRRGAQRSQGDVPFQSTITKRRATLEGEEGVPARERTLRNGNKHRVQPHRAKKNTARSEKTGLFVSCVPPP